MFSYVMKRSKKGAHAPGPPPEQTGYRRVLIVDDEKDFLEMMALRIRGLRPGIEVITTDDGFSAGVHMGRYRPQLVLLDIRMPGMSGIEVCRSIVRMPETAGTKIIGLTSSRNPAELKALRQAGAEGILFKPVTAEMLKDLLDRVFPI